MEIIKQKRFIGAAGLICLILGVFLPFVTVSFMGYTFASVSLWGYWEGKVTTAVIVASAMFMFKDYIIKLAPNATKMEKYSSKLLFIPVAIITILMIILIIEIKGDPETAEYAHFGVAFYLIWVGIAALITHMFTFKVDIDHVAVDALATTTPANPVNTIPESPATAPNITSSPLQTPTQSQPISTAPMQQPVAPAVPVTPTAPTEPIVPPANPTMTPPAQQ